MVNKKLNFVNLLFDLINFFACQQTSDIHLEERSCHHIIQSFLEGLILIQGFKTFPMQYLSFILLPT